MSNVLDLERFRQNKQYAELYESKYLKFLSHVNKFTGVPTSINKCIELFYMSLRYLEGTVNALGILSTIKMNTNNNDVEQLKTMVIAWLQQLIDDIKSI